MSYRPNILFILIDDLGCRDLFCYGSAFYETPNIDRLAKEGILFTRAYASSPVCSPTRASIMTGKYPARIGITQFIGGHRSGRLQDVPYLHYLPLEETTIAAALRKGGYQTWHVGKWHLGDEPFWPEKYGFDINIGGCHFGSPRWPNGYYSPYGIPTLQDGPDGEYLTDRLTDEAIHLIRNRDRRRPFFLNLWHYAVHIPVQAPEPLVAKYRAKAKRLGLDQRAAIIDGEWMESFPPHPDAKPQRVRRRIFQSDPGYAAMVENLDTNIGRLLAALDDENLRDNTLVIFTSDNGGLSTAEGSPTCNLPYREAKGWNYEGGTRVCQIIRWPEVISPHSICHVPVISTDYYPTLLEATGLPFRPEQHCDGISLLPLLRGGEHLEREAIFWHYPHYSNQGGAPAASMIEGSWKLIEHFEDERLELFNLEHDPSETNNLSATDPQRTRRMHRRLKKWQEEVLAKIPERNQDWETVKSKIPNNAHE